MTSLHAASDSLVCCNSIYRTSKLLSPPAGGDPGTPELKHVQGWTNSSLGEKQYIHTDILLHRPFSGSDVREGGKMHNGKKSIK